MWRLDRHQAAWLGVYVVVAVAVGIGLRTGLGWDATLSFAVGIVLSTMVCGLLESAGGYVRRPGRQKPRGDKPEDVAW